MIVNLIPMAGEGKRFKNEGYTIPKPLIPVDGIPMVVKSLQSLPEANKNILIYRSDVLEERDLRDTLEKYFSNVELIGIKQLTEGQASTCLLAEDVIPDHSVLNIGACDIGLEYNEKRYQRTLDKYSSFIWTYTGNRNVLKNPKMYGWVKLKSDGEQIEEVSCKKPISKNLLNDNVVSGTFTFKDSNTFFNAIKIMIAKNDKVNREFYLDNVFNHLDEKSSIFRVKKYSSWGTPDELKTYLHEGI